MTININFNKSVIFLESSENIGGQELQLLQQMHELNRRGWRTELLCKPSSKIMKFAVTEDLNVCPISFRNALDIFSIYKIIRRILTMKAIALVCHSSHDAINAALASKFLGWFRQRPSIIRMRTYQPGIPSSFSYNHLFDHTYTPSYFLRNRLLENSIINPSKVSVLYPGINFDQLGGAPKELPNNLLHWLISHPGPVICQCAMLRNEKGHAVILQALPKVLKEYPTLRYVIAGDGPALANLKELVNKLNLIEHVYFAGMVKPISALLKISTLAVMPSLKEPLGIFQLESQFLQIPTLASKVGGIPETIFDKKTGLLVPAGDVDAWAKSIVWSLDNLDQMQAWVAQGKSFVMNNFSMEKNTTELIKILSNFYNDVIRTN